MSGHPEASTSAVPLDEAHQDDLEQMKLDVEHHKRVSEARRRLVQLEEAELKQVRCEGAWVKALHEAERDMQGIEESASDSL